jgi:hypothetical protein
MREKYRGSSQARERRRFSSERGGQAREGLERELFQARESEKDKHESE